MLSYLEKLFKTHRTNLKKFDQTKKERDLELEIKIEIQDKIESLKDDNQLKTLVTEDEKLIHSDLRN